MKTTKPAALLLAAFLQLAPFAARTIPSGPVLANSPPAIVLRWVIGALAIVGAYHTVSAATAVLASASLVQGTAGTRLSYQIKISDGQNRAPEAWVINGQAFGKTGSTTQGMPPGLSLALNTGIISGIPTQAETFSVTITAYEHPNGKGGRLDFTLTFNIAGSVKPPFIATQPSGGEAIEGSSFTFSVAAAGSTSVAYQWQHAGTAIPNATAATLTLNPIKLSDAGSYTVVVSNSAGSVTSTAVQLMVKAAVISPNISAQPVNVAVHVGEKITLSVAADGSGPLAYQWKRNGIALPDATTASLSVASATRADAGDYAVLISGPGGSVTSSIGTVSVVPLSLAIRPVTSAGISIVMQTIPGRSYVIQAAETLNPEAWQTITVETAAGGTLVFDDSAASHPQRFWRYGPAQ